MRAIAAGVRPKIAMVFFDEETERICEELGYDLILPSAELREHLDSKIVTTRLGNEAGAPERPERARPRWSTWDELVTPAAEAGLGSDLVVQTPYGDSGKTTFFITSEADWDKHRRRHRRPTGEGDEADQPPRDRRRGRADPHGTIVGPFMTELTGTPS